MSARCGERLHSFFFFFFTPVSVIALNFSNGRPNKIFHKHTMITVFLFLVSPGTNCHSLATDQRLLSSTVTSTEDLFNLSNLVAQGSINQGPTRIREEVRHQLSWFT